MGFCWRYLELLPSLILFKLKNNKVSDISFVKSVNHSNFYKRFHGQSLPCLLTGFISLDCGLPANELSPYNETSTRLQFYSDATFIQSGLVGKIQSNLGIFRKPYTTLRYFPDGIRNCYNLNVEKGRKYLIRASFIYGNYDSNDTKPVFDLYLGPNLWATIDLEATGNGIREEILHMPTSNSLKICLVKTGDTTPLISALELRPMENGSYVIDQSGSLKRRSSNYLSKSTFDIR